MLQGLPQILLQRLQIGFRVPADAPAIAPELQPQTHFRRLFETAKDGIMVVDVETETIDDINPWFLWATGFARDEIVGRRLSEAEPLSLSVNVVNLMPAIRAAEMVRPEGRSDRRWGSRMVSGGLRPVTFTC